MLDDDYSNGKRKSNPWSGCPLIIRRFLRRFSPVGLVFLSLLALLSLYAVFLRRVAPIEDLPDIAVDSKNVSHVAGIE